MDMSKRYLKFSVILSGAWKSKICMNEEISTSKLQLEIIKQSLPFHKQCRKLNRFHRATVVSPFNLLFFSFIVIRSLPLESYIIIKTLLPFRKMCPSLGKPGPPHFATNLLNLKWTLIRRCTLLVTLVLKFKKKRDTVVKRDFTAAFSKNVYWEWNLPMTWSVRHNFLKVHYHYQRSYRSTCYY